MTGFGKTYCEYGNKKVSIEIKSLNSRQADIFIKLPGIYKEVELELRNELIKNLERGKIECGIWVDNINGDRRSVINKGIVSDYYKQLNSVAKELDIEEQSLLTIAMRLPDVLKTDRPEFDPDEWKTIFSSAKTAISNLIKYRKKEGASLEKDIVSRIDIIAGLLNAIPEFESKRVNIVKDRIKNNQQEFFDNLTIDNNRFEQELIYYIEKLDITEEKVRLSHHCSYFKETCGESVSNGKKLGFIAQEIGREINTIGSKANEVNIQKIVVQMKDELEKIKEQLLNVL